MSTTKYTKMLRVALSQAEVVFRTELSDLLRDGRHEGIFTIHQKTPLLLCRLPSLDPITDIREPFTFSSEDNLPKLPRFIYPSEKLSATNEVLAHIGLILKYAAAGLVEDEKNTEAHMLLQNRSSRLGDPLDRGQFHSHVQWRGREPAKIDIDEVNDEGVTWPATAKRSVRHIEETMQTETMCAPMDVRSFVRKGCRLPEDIVVEDWSDEVLRLMTTRQ